MTVHAADRNGLELTSVSDSLNSYRLTAVNTKIKKIIAYAAGTRKSNNEFNMFTIGQYDDPRDAAYVAQEFEKKVTKAEVRQMVVDGTFADFARKFRNDIEIPVWAYPAEGMSIDEMLGSVYKRNYVETAREALVEALGIANKKAPALKEAAAMIKKVDDLVKTGLTLRQAAATVVAQ